MLFIAVYCEGGPVWPDVTEADRCVLQYSNCGYCVLCVVLLRKYTVLCSQRRRCCVCKGFVNATFPTVRFLQLFANEKKY